MTSVMGKKNNMNLNNITIKNIDTDDITSKLEKYGKKSEILYNDCKNEGPMDKLPDPTTWIWNQDTMRTSWEEFQLKLENNTNVMKKILLNNSFSKYMSFMYAAYPPGFGKKIKECYDKNIVCDGTEIYLSLIQTNANIEPVTEKYCSIDYPAGEKLDVTKTKSQIKNKKKKDRKKALKNQCVIKDMEGYVLVDPKDISEGHRRKIIESITSRTSVPHCLICGDTETEGKLVKVQGQVLCKECFNIQKNM
jgi:hypothetical protein